jgi:thiopeptide-type bacteriocin biosynthesis protein
MSRFFRHLSSPMTSEQVVAKLPRGFIWAEIGAGPQCSKKDLFEVSLGNLPYIDCFNTPRSGVNKISLSDLSLVFRGGCLLLWSSQRKCFIVPLQSNAVNQMLDQHPAALLLMIVSLQFQTGDVGFRWNSLSGLPWLPRVRIGDTFIAGEQWTLSGQEVLNTLENTGGDEAINNFKKKWRLRGDLFTAHNHGSELCFDLRLPSAARSLKKHARKVLKSAIVLKIEESAFGSSPLGFQLGGEQLTTEFILPFARPITVTQSLSEKEFRGSFNTAAASEILSIVIVASAIGQDAILTEIERLFRRGKVKWFFLRVGVNAEELKLRFFANNSREKKRIRNRIEAFLSKKNIQALFRHWYSDQYQPETSVYDSSVQLNLYHKISNFDSRFAIESILCAEECDDYLPALIESAWLSSLSYARQLEPREQEKSRSSVGSKERVDFYRGKENAIQVLSGARKSPFYPILQRRERAINRLLVKRGKQLLTQPEREIFFRRAVHLSLNRLNSILLRQFEPLIFNEVIGAAEYLRRQSEM